MKLNLKKTSLIGVLIGSLFLSTLTVAAESHPGLGLEAQYSEAVLALNRQEIQKALKILNQILSKNPDYAQALELKALALRNDGQDQLAVNEYLKLVRIRPEKERAPYYFELGALRYRAKKYDLARRYFDRAMSMNFNVSASHFFLGMISFQEGKMSEAENHFYEVKQTGLPEMRIVAGYYLGLAYLKSGSPSRGTRELAQAREQALRIPDNKMASDTLVGIESVLKPYENGQFYGYAMLQINYDSNISATPADTAVQSQASNTSTAQAVVNGGISYASPSLSSFQWLPNYQFSYNKNFNSATEQYEYMSNTGAIYLNYNPLSDISGGVKLQGNYTFQNQPDDPNNLNGSYTLSRYSLGGELGPYFYAQLSKRYRFETELYIRPQEFYTTPELSGTDYLVRLTLQMESTSLYLNPGISLTGENNSASSPDWKYRAVTASAFDMIRLTPKDTLNVALDYIHYDYYISSTGRSDDDINPHLNWIHDLGEKWSLVGQFSYTTNTSTVPASYSYNRLVLGGGISRAL